MVHRGLLIERVVSPNLMACKCLMLHCIHNKEQIGGGPVTANSCCVAKCCSNPQNFILGSCGDPNISRNVKRCKTDCIFGNVYQAYKLGVYGSNNRDIYILTSMQRCISNAECHHIIAHFLYQLMMNAFLNLMSFRAYFFYVLKVF